MKENELKSRLDAELSSITWSVRNSNAVRQQVNQGGTVMKKKLSISFIGVIALLLVLVAVAYAATEVYHRISVNWKGETVEETELPIGPEPTQIPPPDAREVLNDEELIQMADELLRNSVAEDEYGIASYETAGGKMGKISSIQKSFDSWDEFREYMAQSSELTVPSWIPEGYEFQKATVMIVCKADGEYKLIEERQEGAITLKRYKVDESDAVVCWYDISFRESGANNHDLHVNSMLIDDLEADERTFNLTDGESASVITIPGMDDVLAIVRNDPAYNSLAMKRRLKHSIEWIMDPMYAELPEPIEPIVSTCENIDVSSSSLDVETLQKMFTPD